jgi:hypothetical protein
MKLPYAKYANIILPVAGVLLLLVVGAVSYFLGDKHGLEHMTIKHVEPTALAQAMKDDHFYTSYRENTLFIKGTVFSVTKSSNDLQVQFKTNSSYKAVCDFGNSQPVIRPGDSITALTEGGPAVRQPAGVLLKNCLLL